MATNTQSNEDYPPPIYPPEFKALRACLCCGMVKTFAQFYENGCENCDLLQMHTDRERVLICTTAYFDGMIAVVDPKNSWVCRWEGIDDCTPAMYAIKMSGCLPQEDIELCLEKGIQARCVEKKL